MASTSERTAVVTAFIYSEGKIALVKRSQQVGTYKGRWAGFSGYVEQTSLGQAYREIMEETGLAESEVLLRGIGIPVEVDDDHNGDRWLAFPFLFKLADGATIKTDWEAAELSWYTPGEISGLETVPGLTAALKRVWPPFGTQELWDDLEKIAMDTESGATELGRKGLEALGKFVQGEWQNMDRHDLIRTMRALAATRPAMGIFPDLAARLLLAMDRESGEFQLDALITEMIGELSDSAVLSISAAADALHPLQRIFTLSYSKSVADAILAWSSDASVVAIAESGPGMEGLALAEDLSHQGVTVEIVADKDMIAAVRTCDAVLVGCDSITSAKELMNKAGTRAAVDVANSYGIPSYAIAQTVKIAPPGWPVFVEPYKSEERGGTTAFDLTPISSFQAVFTEEGALTEGRLEEIISDLGSVELIPPSPSADADQEHAA